MTILKNIISVSFILILSSVLTGCGGKKDSVRTQNGKLSSSEIPADNVPKKIEMKTKTGMTFVINIISGNGSLSDIGVTGSGFENSRDTVFFRDVYPYEQAVLADIDGNGYEEIYIITKSTGSGSYLNLYSVASNNDKSYTPVNVQSIDDRDLKPGKNFEGYMGHERFIFEKGRIIREFPVFKEGDTNANPTGGTKKIYYKLSRGEASWQLKVAEENKK